MGSTHSTLNLHACSGSVFRFIPLFSVPFSERTDHEVLSLRTVARSLFSAMCTRPSSTYLLRCSEGRWLRKVKLFLALCRRLACIYTRYVHLIIQHPISMRRLSAHYTRATCRNVASSLVLWRRRLVARNNTRYSIWHRSLIRLLLVIT